MCNSRSSHFIGFVARYAVCPFLFYAISCAYIRPYKLRSEINVQQTKERHGYWSQNIYYISFVVMTRQLMRFVVYFLDIIFASAGYPLCITSISLLLSRLPKLVHPFVQHSICWATWEVWAAIKKNSMISLCNRLDNDTAMKKQWFHLLW